MSGLDALPDARDGLTRLERIILHTLRGCQAECGDRPVPSTWVYGRVCERIPVSPRRFQEVLARLTGR